MYGTVGRRVCCQAEHVSKESGEGLLRHLARGHGEFLVLDLAAAAYVAHTNVVRWIEKCHVGALATHQPVQVACFARVAA
jgi:hypothetical protein